MRSLPYLEGLVPNRLFWINHERTNQGKNACTRFRNTVVLLRGSKGIDTRNSSWWERIFQFD